MKVSILLLFLSIFGYSRFYAQDVKEVQLGEVHVEAAKVVEQPTGRLIFPTKSQRESSANAYGLLGKLSLPKIRIDEVLHSITALGNEGEVQIRINGALASKEDLLAVDPTLVKSIDFIDNPGLRYGRGITYVIDIMTRSSNAGYSVGFDLSNSVTTWNGDHAAYIKMNCGKSELGFVYDFTYQDSGGTRVEEHADYLLTNDSHYKIDRIDKESRFRRFDNDLELKYSLVDSTNYTFLATLSGRFCHVPGDFNKRDNWDGANKYVVMSWDNDKSFTPVVDLYFHRRLGENRSVTANMVGTYISTNAFNYQNEGSAYQYQVDGKTWSLMSEAIYEHRLKPLTLTMGLQHHLKHTRNDYREDVNAVNNMMNSGLYLYGEASGKWHNLNYIAGLGVSQEYYTQGESRYHYWLFRTKFTIGYTPIKSIMLRYRFEIDQHISRVAMISNTRIRENSMEWTVGNPDVKPNGVTRHMFDVNFTKPRLQASINMEYRQNHHANMANYERTADDQFLDSQVNQPSIDMFYVSGNVSYDILKDHLTVSAFGGINRFINHGNDYSHYLTTYSYGSSLQAYLDRWTFTAYVDNGWEFMEGETQSKQMASSYLGSSYRFGNCNISVFWQHPFQTKPRMGESEIVNRFVKKKITEFRSDYGNMLTIAFSWNLHQGSNYHQISKKLKNEDTQTGILK